RTINNRARELGFSTSIGIIHNGSGRLKPLGPAERQVYDAVSAAISGPWQVFKNLYSGISSFQDNLVDGKPNDWRCRAGGRYLYICEDGLVHYCSQQRGYPGVPLDSYTTDDIRREFSTPKPCAPYCTVGCVHRVSTMDFWRSPQALAAEKRPLAVTDDCADVQPLSRVPFALHVPFPLDLAHDPDVDAGLDALRNQPQHRVVAHPRVVNQELFARAADEPPETLARVLGADHETRVTRDIRPAVEVGHEQLGDFVHELLVPADDAEAAARRDVEAGEI